MKKKQLTKSRSSLIGAALLGLASMPGTATAIVPAGTQEASGAISVPACSAPLIDDFSVGTYRSPDLVVGTDAASQAAPVLGGRRTTDFTSGLRNPYAMPATLVIPGDGKAPLVASTGYQGNSRLRLWYGFDKNRQLVPLNANLSCFDRFRVRIAGSDQSLNIVVQVKSGSAVSVYQSGTNTVGAMPAGGTIDFKLSTFTNDDLGAPPVDWKDIDRILLQVQPTVQVGIAPFGSIDYAIARFDLARPAAS
ncbi:hypothetical protein F0U44_08940 [Nocardioides humilatus]|uniref:Uncharacterized protein n=1 Tax=Nocardioides humilatus TaxID=2607660 RepID=A0A5B1LD84_9ACTN|nr:hypothetical protein [Nocardioides humilatus]KAA1418615.1 hypothetical protein F0U44_08940 [Nocardioides humilatus]